MATETAVALDSNFKLLLMSRISVAVEKMVASCYNRDQTCLYVYCWCQTPSGVVSPWAASSGSPGAAKQHPSLIPTIHTHSCWSLNYIMVGEKKQCSKKLRTQFTMHSWDFVRNMHSWDFSTIACHVSHASCYFINWWSSMGCQYTNNDDEINSQYIEFLVYVTMGQLTCSCVCIQWKKNTL